MTRLFGRDESGVARIFGMPVSRLWSGDGDAVFDTFEPENPSLFVPRKFGVGWDLNLGVIAVKAGWIRSDDSLPDLADHVSPTLKKALCLAPKLGAVGVMASALALAGKDRVASGWGLTGLPRGFTSGKKAIIPPLLLAALTAAGPLIATARTSEHPQAANFAWQAQQVGSQATALALLLAMHRSSRGGEHRDFLPVVAVALWPLLACGLQIAYVKTALNNINTQLRDVNEGK